MSQFFVYILSALIGVLLVCRWVSPRKSGEISRRARPEPAAQRPPSRDAKIVWTVIALAAGIGVVIVLLKLFPIRIAFL